MLGLNHIAYIIEAANSVIIKLVLHNLNICQVCICEIIVFCSVKAGKQISVQLLSKILNISAYLIGAKLFFQPLEEVDWISCRAGNVILLLWTGVCQLIIIVKIVHTHCNPVDVLFT